MKLYKISNKEEVEVTRAGQKIYIDQDYLITGDILSIKTGLILPADAILFQCYGAIKADESSMTGESRTIMKSTEEECAQHASWSPFLMSGSKISEGDGTALVVAVGKNSKVGQLSASLRIVEEATPLQIRLDAMAGQIGLVGTVGASLAFVCCFINLCLRCIFGDEEFISMQFLSSVLDYIILAVTILVMAVPEGLPMAVLIALAYSVLEMGRNNNTVKNLAACETMSTVSEICTDKTGTLTKNEMEVKYMYLGCGLISLTAPGQINKLKSSETNLAIVHSICKNSDCNVDFTKDVIIQKGNPTEKGLLVYANSMGVDYRQFREAEKCLNKMPFSSEKKRAACIYKEKDGRIILHVKGAPDIIVETCSHYTNDKEQNSEMNVEFKSNLYNNTLKELGAEKARTIGVCIKELNANVDVQNFDWDLELKSGMTFLGLVGIADPLRADVPDAIKRCKNAGINVRICTGDAKEIAVAIGKECGLIDKDFAGDEDPYRDEECDFTVMLGKDFREFCGGLIEVEDEDDNKDEGCVEHEEGHLHKEKLKKYKVGNIANFRKCEKYLKILARSQPEDKTLLVTGLQEMGKIVAVTGDGTNDAPALKKSNVGFAMGKAGTAVCKAASKIILNDDSFSSIVIAVKYGRNVFDSIRKFVQFQLTVNIVAMSTAIVGGLVLEESPINAIQMLWINMIMDTFAALGLATDPPVDELLDRKPIGVTESIITKFMWQGILFNSACQFVYLMLILAFTPKLLGIESTVRVTDWNYENGLHYTFFFHVFVF